MGQLRCDREALGQGRVGGLLGSGDGEEDTGLLY